MLKKLLSKNLPLLLILTLAFFTRIYSITDVPAGFFCDEAAIGYNAYSILTTGRDEYGKIFPVFFRSFDDYKPPLAIYSTVPFIYIFGLTELSVRLQSFFYGIVTIIGIYLLGKEAVSKKLGLWSAFIAATMPWLIHYNRIGFDNSIYPAFFIFAIYLCLKSEKNKKYILPFFIILALTLYTYQPARLIVFLLLPFLLWIHRKAFLLHKKELVAGLLLFFIIAAYLILSFFTGEGLARFSQVSLFTARLSFSDMVFKALYNYFIQLTPGYLFLNGEPTPITRHFTQGLLPLLGITAPFLFLGLFFAVKNIRKKFFQLLLFLLIIYPVGGALVADGPFTSRDIIGAPIFAFLIALGIMAFAEWIKKTIPYPKIISTFIAILILANCIFFLRFYFITYPLYSSGYWGWQYGPKYIVSYFLKEKNNYDDEIMQPIFNGPDIFFKFYAPNNCSKCRLGVPDNMLDRRRKQLFALTPDYLLKNPGFHFKTKKTIYYPNGSIAFVLGEIGN